MNIFRFLFDAYGRKSVDVPADGHLDVHVNALTGNVSLGLYTSEGTILDDAYKSIPRTAHTVVLHAATLKTGPTAFKDAFGFEWLLVKRYNPTRSDPYLTTYQYSTKHTVRIA